MARQRGIMALIGALAGGSFHLLGLMIEAEWLAGRLALAAAVLAGVFFGGLLVTAGRLRLRRAAFGALAVGLGLALLVLFASSRFDAAEGVVTSALPLIAALVLATLPWPFLIAAAGAGWRDYPTLFSESWGIVVRVTVAMIFTGIVWLVIYLSDALLGLVGLTFLDWLLAEPLAVWLITGTGLGLAMAVVDELADVLSPGLVLRLFRLLVPVVLVVMAIFLVALPLRGFDTIFGTVSSALVLLAMAGAAVTLVTSALDQEDALAAHSRLLIQATRALAALSLLPAALATWALWLRVEDHGWTPERLLAASITALALAYGVLYLAAVLRGRDWKEHVRQANVWMALATMGLAVLWLTLLNPEAIAARSQLARIADGRTKVEEIDLYAFSNWGLAGEAALASLKVMAGDNAALAARLAAQDAPAAPEPDPAALRLALTRAMPLQPSDAEARTLRDRLFAAVEAYDLQSWTDACAATLPQGGPGCVLVVADFLPDQAGEEAMLFTRSSDGYLTSEGFDFATGTLRRRGLTSYDGSLPEFDGAAALIDQLQHAAAPLKALPLNALALPGQPALVFAP